MSKQIINYGTAPNSRDGELPWYAWKKVKENFDELYTVIQGVFVPPSQTGNAGKVLSTDGSTTSWITPSAGVIPTTGVLQWDATNKTYILHTDIPSTNKLTFSSNQTDTNVVPVEYCVVNGTLVVGSELSGFTGGGIVARTVTTSAVVGTTSIGKGIYGQAIGGIAGQFDAQSSSGKPLICSRNGETILSVDYYGNVNLITGAKYKINGVDILNGFQANLGFTPENVANKGVTNGYPSLDNTGKIPISQIPNISGNGNIAISSTDTAQDYIINKLSAGSNIILTKLNSGGNEQIMISAISDPSSLVWGIVSGNITNQTDLINLLNAKQNLSNKGVANGYAGLDSSGVIPLSQIPASLIGGLDPVGVWDAASNTPTLVNGVGTKGWLYIINIPGNTTIDTNTNWNIGDSIFFDGTKWNKISGQNVTVTRVFGRVGDITAQAGDYNADQISQTNNWKFITPAQQIQLINLSAQLTTLQNNINNASNDAIGMAIVFGG